MAPGQPHYVSFRGGKYAHNNVRLCNKSFEMVQSFPRDGHGVVDDALRRRLRPRSQPPAKEGAGLLGANAVEKRPGFFGS